jgi:energy-coupling factor transporter ATP-binding protein EcfA2
MRINDIAKQLNELNENIVIVYAFNATGKTRLSVAYKDETKKSNNGQHAGVYYNAFSEDLFVWDNDEENDGADIRLTIRQSSLNQFHSFLYENREAVLDKLAMYAPNYVFEFVAHENLEDGIEFIRFFVNEADKRPIKISRGEERIFVWCFFLALLDVDGWANEQDAHIFIDDPVSSLDEHNIYVTAESIFQLVETHYLKKRVIVTTHHIGLFSILADRLTKGSKGGRYKNLTKLCVLTRNGDALSLTTPNKSVFLFHLHVLQLLVEASGGELFMHHIVMLRQVLENVASFMGRPNFGFTLTQIGVADVDDASNVINSLSHKDAYYYQSNLMPPAVQTVFRDVLDKLLDKYKFDV